MRFHAAFVGLSLVFASAGCASSHIAERTAPMEQANFAPDSNGNATAPISPESGLHAKNAEGLFQQSPLDAAKRDFVERAPEGFGIDRQSFDREGLPITDEQIAKVLDWHALLPAAARLSLLEARAVREWCTCGSWGTPDVRVEGTQWAVRPSTAEEVNAMRDELGKCGRVASVSTVPAMFLPYHADLGRCRYAAARANSDLMLIYAKSTRIVKFHNRLANLYPLIVGLALPGEETAIVTRVEGAIVDVRTGRVFACSQSTARTSDMSTVFTSSDEAREQLVDKTEREAVLALAKGIRDELEVTAAQPAPPAATAAPAKAAKE
jgi:hypothetical protein